MVNFLVILVQYLSELPQNRVIYPAVVTLPVFGLLVHLDELLLQNCQFVLYVLHVSSKGRLDIEILSTANFGQALLDSLTNLLREFQSRHTVLYLHICRVQVCAEDHFGLRREHGLAYYFSEQSMVLWLEWTLKG